MTTKYLQLLDCQRSKNKIPDVKIRKYRYYLNAIYMNINDYFCDYQYSPVR